MEQHILPIANRRMAGKLLARRLAHRYKPDALADSREEDHRLVLALPRGGIPVAYEIAKALSAPLDILPVRKLRAPMQPELAIGAIAAQGAEYLNQDIISALGLCDEAVEQIVDKSEAALQRSAIFLRGNRPLPVLNNKQILLVDDGIATGATMRAAIRLVHSTNPARLIIAIPVAPSDTLSWLRQAADEVIFLASPVRFTALSAFYTDFASPADNLVRRLLHKAWSDAQRQYVA